MLPLLVAVGRAPADDSRAFRGPPPCDQIRQMVGKRLRRRDQTKATCDIYRLKMSRSHNSQILPKKKRLWGGGGVGGGEMSSSDLPRCRQTAAAQFAEIHPKMDAEPQTVKEN